MGGACHYGGATGLICIFRMLAYHSRFYNFIIGSKKKIEVWLTLDFFLIFRQFFVSLQDGVGLCTLSLQELLQNLLSLQKTCLLDICIDFDSNRNQVTEIS